MTVDTETVFTVIVILAMAVVFVIARFSRPPEYTEAQRARTRAAAEKNGLRAIGRVLRRPASWCK